MVEGFLGSLSYFSDPSFVLWLVGGVLVGLIVGIIPGISGMSALAIFLPFAFVLKPAQALPFMVAVCATTFTGGVITAVLVGIPGDAPNAASCLDGFPMTQKGEGGRALGAALISSGVGGLVSGVLALVMVPVVLVLIYAITSADMVFVILLGILCIGGLATGSITKGMISGGLGLLISFIGFQAVTSVERFTFGSRYLYTGIPLLPFTLGLFAMPVMIQLIKEGRSISNSPAASVKGMKDVLQGGKDILHNFGIFLRSVIIGYIIGVIPGIGSTTSTFVAYSQAKQTSKDGADFGTGNVKGLIAASCGTNASLGGDLLTTLALGIPGSATMAILMGGMLMVGLIPGPRLLVEHLDLSLALIYTVMLANIVGVVIALFFIPQLVKVATLPNNILVAAIIPLIFIGTYAAGEQFQDLIVLVIMTFVGVLVQQFKFNGPALFLGYVLGSLFEKYFFIALRGEGPFFFVRPISLVLIALCIAVILIEPMRGLLKKRRLRTAPAGQR